jgi:NitT/TauT family transport system substrate-binding protein
MMTCGAIGALSRLSSAQTVRPLRVACLPTDGASQVYYAKDLDLFAKAGLAVDVQALPSSSMIAAAVASSAVDIGYGTIDVLAQLRSKNVFTLALAGANEWSSPQTSRSVALVLPDKSPIREAKDLNGKVVAVGALRSVADTASRAWIEEHHGDASTVRFVEVSMPGMPAALDAARIDAALVIEPYLGVALAQHRALAYGVYDGIAQHFVLGAWFCRAEWAKSNPDLANRFIEVMRETALWANANTALSATILAKYTKLDSALVATIVRSRYAVQLLAPLVQPLIDASAKYNGFPTFAARDLMYRTN